MIRHKKTFTIDKGLFQIYPNMKIKRCGRFASDTSIHQSSKDKDVNNYRAPNSHQQ